jgi:hypothetical protein
MSHIVEGDFVMGETKVGLVHGKVEHIMIEGGTLGSAGSEYALQSMPPENPAMSVRIYEEQKEKGSWKESAYSIGMMHNDATKLDRLEGHHMNTDMEMGKSYHSDDEEMDKWDNMTKACWVGYEQRGMKDKGGRMVPNCVPVGKTYDMDDEIEKAKSVSVGDHVTFGVPKPPDKTESAHGVVERVERSGTVNIAGTNEKVEASADNPVAVIRVYATNEKGKRTKTDRRVAKPVKSLRISSEPIDNEKMYDTEETMEKASSSKLKELVENYNKGKDSDKRITVETLQSVYRRGIGAYRTNPSSVRGSVSSAEQWAMGRVNAFMAGLRGRFPRKPFDLDLFPKGHPRSTKKSLFEDFAKNVDKPERVVKLFPESNPINKKEEGWGGSIFDLNPFKNNG